MITKDEIRDIATFNASTLQEGLRQAEQRLEDCFNKKATLEKKAFTLLAVFLPFATAVLSAPLILNIVDSTAYWISIAVGGCLLVGTAFLFCSLKGLSYGTLGRYPDTWLQPGVLDGDDNMKCYVMANVLFDYQQSIAISDASNNAKVRLVDRGIAWGIAAPFAFLFCTILVHLLGAMHHFFG